MSSKIYYNTIYKSYSSLYHREQISKIEKIKSLLIFENKKVLDLGCGDGVLNNFIKENNEVYSCDNSENMLLLNKNKNKFLVDLNKENLPFEKEFFDYVFCFSVFQDLENFKILEEIKRVSKNNCKIVISHIKISKKKKVIESDIKKLFEIKKIIEDKIDLIYILN